MQCRDCDGEGRWPSPLDGEVLCDDCGRRELIGLLIDCDAEELSLLRRRIEDHIRKSPASLIDTACMLILAGRIRYDDLI